MKNCLIVVNSFKPRSLPLFREIESFLLEKGICVKKFIYDGNDAQNKSVCTDFKGNDFVITLGGDGTVLFVARNCAPLGIPVFSVNLGEFGFLAGVQVENWKSELEKYLEGKSSVSFRALLDCEVLRGGKTIFRTNCVNDCVISSSASLKLINLNVAYNHALLGPFKTNGIIVATPTGSTAYNLSNGGPIIIPQSGSLCLTPVAPHSLNIRPIVINDTAEITLDIESRSHNYLVAIDGRSERMTEETRLIIRKAPHTIKIVKQRNQRYFSTLREKLMWGADQRER